VFFDRPADGQAAIGIHLARPIMLAEELALILELNLLRGNVNHRAKGDDCQAVKRSQPGT
jgi:hypothetical protein